MANVAYADNIRVLRRPASGQDYSGRRMRADWAAALHGEGFCLPCSVSDISNFGANVVIENLPVEITNAFLEVKGLPAVPVTVVWRRQRRVGLHFAVEQGWVSDRCRARFDPSAWLPDQASVQN